MGNPAQDGPAQQTSKYEISRDELLKYIEIDLWSRFQARLWSLLGVFLTVVTVAGFFGVPYYIRSEMDRRLTEQQASFERRTSEILRHAQLLNILSVKYLEARSDLQTQVARARQGVRRYQEEHPPAKGESRFVGLPELLRELDDLASRSEYSTAVGQEFRYPRFVPDSLANVEVMPGIFISQEIRGPVSSTSSRVGHPIQNGTLAGVLKDIRFRVVELEAYRRALNDVQTHFTELGGSTPLEKRQEMVALDTLHREIFSPRYAEFREAVSRELLTKSDLDQYMKYRDLYSLDRPN